MTVSVCIPTFNYGRFLPDAIGSVVSQTFGDFELVIVDNCSTDDTPRVVEAFARRESRIRYFRNARNLGICGNFNRALELATGDYVKILCADDWLAPRALEKSLAALSRHPDAALVTTGRLLMSELRERVGFESYCRKSGMVNGYAAINHCLFGTNYVGEPSAVIFRRRLASRGFDERYPHLLDMEMWFHLLEQGALACIAEPLAMIRLHGAQTTRGNAPAGRIVDDKKRLFSTYSSKPYVTTSRWKTFVWRLRTAYNVWSARRGRDQDSGGGSTVSEFVPTILFYLALPGIIALDRARKLLGRLRAGRAGDRAD